MNAQVNLLDISALLHAARAGQVPDGLEHHGTNIEPLTGSIDRFVRCDVCQIGSAVTGSPEVL